MPTFALPHRFLAALVTLTLTSFAVMPASAAAADPLSVAAHQFADEDYRAARKTLLEYLPSSKGLDHALTQLHLGDCDFKLREYTRAAEEINAALTEMKAAGGAPILHIDALAALGVAQFDEKQFEQSLATFHQISSSAEAAANPLIRGWSMLAEATILTALQREPAAADKKKEAMLCFRDNLFHGNAVNIAMPELSVGHRQWWRLAPHIAGSPVKLWRPTESPRAIVLAIHGLGLNKEAFEGFAEEMLKRNIETVAMDVRGFGAWQRLPGTARTVSFTDAVDDIRSALEIIREKNPDKPVYLLGESMGGALVLAASANSNIAGVISSVPAAERYNEASRAGRIALHYLLDRDQEIDIGKQLVKDAEKDPDARRRWLRDPRARFKMSPRELRQFNAFMKSVERDANAPRPPLLMTQGAADRLVKQDATIELFNRLNSKDKNLVLLGHTQHLIFEYNTPQKTLCDSIDAWLTNHPIAR